MHRLFCWIIGPIQAITTVKHKNYLITGSADGSIKLLDLENKMQIHSFNNSDPDSIYF